VFFGCLPASACLPACLRGSRLGCFPHAGIKMLADREGWLGGSLVCVCV
jgi:hypothetical protein